MATTVNQYLLGLTRSTGLGLAARLSGLFNIGLDAPQSPSAAMQLAALQALDEAAWAEVVTEAWLAANDGPCPDGPGYVHFGGEVVLDTLRRLKG